MHRHTALSSQWWFGTFFLISVSLCFVQSLSLSFPEQSLGFSLICHAQVQGAPLASSLRRFRECPIAVHWISKICMAIFGSHVGVFFFS